MKRDVWACLMDEEDSILSCSSVRAFASRFCLLTAPHVHCQHLAFVYISSLSIGSAQFKELSLSSL